jgi:hypothetical protein
MRWELGDPPGTVIAHSESILNFPGKQFHRIYTRIAGGFKITTVGEYVVSLQLRPMDSDYEDLA